jgi:hypothetical protein
MMCINALPGLKMVRPQGYTGDLLLHPDGTCLNTWEKNQFGTQLAPVGCIGFPVELDDDDVCALDDDDD